LLKHRTIQKAYGVKAHNYSYIPKHTFMKVTITKIMKTDQRLNPSLSYKLSTNYCYIDTPQDQKYSIKKMYMRSKNFTNTK